MERCPKCGADAYGFIDASGAGIYKCGSTDHGFDPEHPEPFVSNLCLRRQLAAANETIERLRRKDCLVCGWCAASFNYETDADGNITNMGECIDAAQKHDAECARNPLVVALAASKERVGELEREQENLRMAWRRGSDPFLSSPGSVKIGFWTGDYDTIDRILGGCK